MSRVRLPNGQELFCINAAEALLLYEDIYRDRSYLKHGISIRDHDCIFDVGANIGLFTLFAKQQASNLQLYVFEPIPPIFEVLKANAHQHNLHAELFQCGLAAVASVAQFAFYPRNSAMSGQHWDPQQEKQVAKAILRNKHPDLAEYLDDVVETAFEPTLFDCSLRALSDVILERNVQKIDLLKIDVEKSELEVLCGISDSHWPLIRQVVVEVHDIDGRLQAIGRLLESRGFATTVAQNTHFRDTGLFDIYASRTT